VGLPRKALLSHLSQPISGLLPNSRRFGRSSSRTRVFIDRFFCRNTFPKNCMAESAYLPGLAIQNSEVLDSSRHSALVRVTHWIHALSFFALVVSGIAILLAHTRFYWGDTGGEGAPSLFDLPLPLHRANVSGWGRSLHFLSAWTCVLNGFFYAVSGLVSQHFRFPVRPYLALSRGIPIDKDPTC